FFVAPFSDRLLYPSFSNPVPVSICHLWMSLLRSPKFDNPSQQIPYLGNFITSQPINLGDRSSPSHRHRKSIPHWPRLNRLAFRQ
ncbi:MAG: hypothetical protein V7K22_00075, partial [Nostoc sp.]